MTQVDVSSIPSMEDLLSCTGELRRMVKVGEGSYGEAFRQGRCGARAARGAAGAAHVEVEGGGGEQKGKRSVVTLRKDVKAV